MGAPGYRTWCASAFAPLFALGAPLFALGALLLVFGGACRDSDKSESEPESGADNQANATAPTPANTPDHGSATPGQGLGLVVLIVIDQLPSWSFEHDLAFLDGGIPRLVRDGQLHPTVEIPFAITYTAPGHAALGTGAPPSDTRILANNWYDTASGAKISATDDSDSPVFLIDGHAGHAGHAGQAPAGLSAPEQGASGKRLAVDGLADVLRQVTAGKGKSVSVSIKERGAIFAIGRRPDLAIWYDASQPAMTTSRYYADQAPTWLFELARAHPITSRFGWVWQRLPEIDHAVITSHPDDSPGELLGDGMGHTFPFDLAKADNAAEAIKSMPIGDDLVFETATMAIEAEGLGRDEVTDLLALSLSSHDYAGHNWGQESWERLDLMMRLDDKLGVFLDTLDARVGKGRYAVVLTSDHGATPLTEHSVSAGHKARRITNAELLATANNAATSVLGPGRWMSHVAASSLYASSALLAVDDDTRGRVFDAMVRDIRALEGVGYVARTDRIAGACNTRDGADALACHSVALDLSGQIFVSAAENHVITNYPTGSGHGSSSLPDRLVPLIVYAPGWPAKRVEGTDVSQLQIAPTLAALLGIPAPPAAHAPALHP